MKAFIFIALMFLNNGSQGSGKYLKILNVLMTALHIIGGNSIQSNNEGEIDCGNGKRADSCGNCKQSGVNAELWCGGDCEWDDFFSQCNQKIMSCDDDAFKGYFSI